MMWFVLGLFVGSISTVSFILFVRESSNRQRYSPLVSKKPINGNEVRIEHGNEIGVGATTSTHFKMKVSKEAKNGYEKR
jgi:hypothetical protein